MQLDLLLRLYVEALDDARARWEIPASYESWVDGDRIVGIAIGAHSIDLRWPWWQPWSARELTTGRTYEVKTWQPPARRRRAARP